MSPPAHGRHAKLQARVLYLLNPRADAVGLTVLAEFNLGEPEWKIAPASAQRGSALCSGLLARVGAPARRPDLSIGCGAGAASG